MTRSERVYRTLLMAYPADHRAAFGDEMVQLFRDRLRRDGGGLGSAAVWVHAGLDLAGSAFIERLETAMNLQTYTSRWWEATIVVYAIVQVVMGSIFTANGYPGWATLVGFLPAALLLGGLALRERRRPLATALIVVGAVLPAIAFWMLYPFVVAPVVIGAGWYSGKLGVRTAEVAST
jgi:hypothetical protein